MPEPTLAELFADREAEEYLISARNERHESFSDWKERVQRSDDLIRGMFSYRNPDGVSVSADLLVMNLADQVPRDLARLSSEAEPSYSAPAYGDKKADDENATLRSVIGRGYFEGNNFDLIRPQIVMDLAITGTWFVCVWPDDDGDYPRLMRIDPRGCYPDTFNGELQDLLVVQRIKRRVAERLFPGVEFGPAVESYRGKPPEDVEIWDYYGPEFCAKAVTNMVDGKPLKGTTVTPVGFWGHDLGKTPVGFAQLPSPDGAYRGVIDQIGPSLAAKNRAVNLMLEYAHEGIYAPFEEKGIINPSDLPGPGTIYHHNPSATESFMRRMAPASFNPQLFGLIQYLDLEERGQMGYPQTRQGEVGVSQGSASYITASQGQLTSMVRETQRLLTDTQEHLAALAYEVDEKFLDFEKPLVWSVGDKKTYVPSRAIKGHYRLDVSYGAGAGLDRINTDTRLLNFFSAGVLSAETMLNQTDFIPDGTTELERRENEELSRVILQRFAQDPSISLDFVSLVYSIKRDTGVTLIEAYAEALAQQATAQPELPAQPGAPELPAGEVVPDAGAPAAAPEELPAVTFSPPSRQQVLVNTGR